jgi:hypothetical protein
MSQLVSRIANNDHEADQAGGGAFDLYPATLISPIAQPIERPGGGRQRLDIHPTERQNRQCNARNRVSNEFDEDVI